MSDPEERHELPAHIEAAMRLRGSSMAEWMQDVGEKVAALLIKELGEQGVNICHAMLDSDELHERAAEYAEGGEGFLTGVSAGLKKEKA